MSKILHVTVIFLMMLTIASCTNGKLETKPRTQVDTTGFASHKWQVDSVISRIERLQAPELERAGKALEGTSPLRLAISPHDDYSYVGYLYPALLSNVKSRIVILIGVGHKAASLGLEDKLVFGSFRRWRSPAGTIRISELQNKIMAELPGDMYTVNDTMQAVEHSLEALVPFLEYYNSGTEIIPVIVPPMSFERMEEIASALGPAIINTMDQDNLEWGSGWTVVISTDAVHYGNEGWSGRNYDRFGVDSAGYKMAVGFENEIINNTLAGELSLDKIREFSRYTVQDSDYHEYKWTWCGRYSVPLGLLTAYDMSLIKDKPLSGILAGYSTSIAGQPLPVTDIGMGVTAPAGLTHWVGYAAIGYK